MKPTHFRRAINTTIMSKTASFELLVEMCDKVGWDKGIASMCSADVETYTNTIKSNKDGRFENI
mgnify:CR=1 FL=1